MPDKDDKKSVSKGKKIKFALFTLLFLVVIIIVLSEIILAFMKYPSSYDKMKKVSYTQAKWWTCDSISGPRYVAHQATLEDSVYFLREIWYYKRLMMINNDGYHDKDNFTAISPESDSIKILAAGDSFTWGASSDIGSSFIDILESDVNKVHPALVWNTGIPATGTNHAIFTTKKYLPVQHSNYVVLGFYAGNDFGDNLLPYDRIVFNKLASCYSQYDFDKNMQPVKISNREAYKIATGSYPLEELNFFQKILARSRFIAFTSELMNKVQNRVSGSKEKAKELEYKLTRDYLKELDEYVKSNNAELIVLIIPSLNDVKKKDEHYFNALKLFKELSIRYVDPIDQLTTEDYLTIDGGHWHNSGHIKAGHLLSKYLLDRIKEKTKPTLSKELQNKVTAFTRTERTRLQFLNFVIQRKRPTGDDLLTVSKKQEMSLNLFWYGLVVYMIFFVLAAAEAPFLTAASAQGIQAIGLLLMIAGGAGLMTFKFDDGYLKNLFIINLLYSVTIIMRGAQFDKDSIKQMLFDPWFGVFPYLCSVFVLLPRNITAYKKIFNILLIFGAAFLVFVFTFYNTLHDYDRLNLVAQGLVENLSVFLALPVGYMLISYPYHTKGKKDLFGIGKKNAFMVFMFAVTLFFAIFRARRGLIFMCATTFLCVGMVAILSTKKKMLIIVMASIMILIGGAFIASMKEHSAFNFLMERGEEDTRSGVEVWLYADMSSADWVIGKGIKGKYYCPIVDNVNDAEGQGYRDNIETGYLQIILKGGILSLAFHLLMFFPAVYKGLFKSRNVLSKAAALWIFLWIIYLYPSGGIVFSMNYILVWIATGICYSDKIRNLSDETIKTHLQ